MTGKKVASVRTPVKPYNRTEHDGKRSGGTVKIKWVVSFISCTDDMRQTIRGLGLRRMHQVVERQDTPSVRRATDPIKVLGDGELTTKLAIHAQAFSASAKEKITKAGGTFEVVA